MAGAVTFPCWKTKREPDHRHNTRAEGDACDAETIETLFQYVATGQKKREDLEEKLAFALQAVEIALQALESVITVHNSQTAIQAVHRITGKYGDRVI